MRSNVGISILFISLSLVLFANVIFFKVHTKVVVKL